MQILYAVAALGGVALVFGALLGVVARFFTVESDSRVEAVRDNYLAQTVVPAVMPLQYFAGRWWKALLTAASPAAGAAAAIAAVLGRKSRHGAHGGDRLLPGR